MTRSRARVSGLRLFALVLTMATPIWAQSWAPLTNPTPDGQQAYRMRLLTDGTVMVQSGSSGNWLRLTPDSSGSYIDGNWTSDPINPMSTNRFSFASQVLQSGKVWVFGGENYGPNDDDVWTATGTIWNPVTNIWSNVATFPPQACFPVTYNVTGRAKKMSNEISGLPKPVTPTFLPGWTVSGAGIPSGATITSVVSSSEVLLSANATITGEAALAFTGTPTSCFGDEESMLVPGGKIFAAGLVSGTYLYSIANNSWSFAANKVYESGSDEEGWTKLSDGRILTYDIGPTINTGQSYAEVYDPVANVWSGISPADGSANGTLPLLTSVASDYEIGPSLRLLDGRSFLIGATGHTALYTPATNTWAAGPDIMGTLNGNPALFGADDAPAAILPTGHVLLAADAGPTLGAYSPPTELFDFDPTAGTISPVSPALNDPFLDTNSYQTSMLMLPTGQLLFADGSYQLWVYTPGGSANTIYQPVITKVKYNNTGVFTLTGRQLNGQSAGANYGDDAQMDENYPIVSLVNSSGQVFYCRTTDWSNVGVATGTTPETVEFTLNSGVTAGSYNLIVSGAGISSAPFPINITASEVGSQ